MRSFAEIFSFVQIKCIFLKVKSRLISWPLWIMSMNRVATFLWKRHIFLLKISSKIRTAYRKKQTNIKKNRDRNINAQNILLNSIESIHSKDTCVCYLGRIHKFYDSNHFVLFWQDRSSIRSKRSVYFLWWELAKFWFS